MKTQHKQMYESPQAFVFEVRAEGVVCTSPTQNFNPSNPFGSSTEEDW